MHLDGTVPVKPTGNDYLARTRTRVGGSDPLLVPPHTSHCFFPTSPPGLLGVIRVLMLTHRDLSGKRAAATLRMAAGPNPGDPGNEVSRAHTRRCAAAAAAFFDGLMAGWPTSLEEDEALLRRLGVPTTADEVGVKGGGCAVGGVCVGGRDSMLFDCFFRWSHDAFISARSN